MGLWPSTMAATRGQAPAYGTAGTHWAGKAPAATAGHPAPEHSGALDMRLWVFRRGFFGKGYHAG